MSLLITPDVKDSHILVENHVIFPKKQKKNRPRRNLKVLLIPNLDLCEKPGKVVIK